MQKIKLSIFLFFIVNILFTTNIYAQEKLLDQVVAIVNSQVITQSELNQQMKVDSAQGRSVSDLHQQALNELINIALQKNIAKKAHIIISDVQVDATIAKIAAQNNMTMAQLQKSLSAHGMSFAAYRHQIHDQMLIEEVQHLMVAPKVKVVPEDIQAANNSAQAVAQPRHINPNVRYHVVDILVLDPKNAGGLLSKIRSSENPGNVLNHNPAVKITDLGFRKLSDLPGIFVGPVEYLSPGQFSGLIDAPNGVHIISLISVQGRGYTPPAPVLTPQQIAYQKKFKEVLAEWLRTLRSESYVKILN